MLILIIFQHLIVYEYWCVLQFLWMLYGCYNLLLSKVADVTAIMLCVADGKLSCMLQLLSILMEDVIVKVADE